MAKLIFLCLALLICFATLSNALNYRAVIGVMSRDIHEKPITPNTTSVIQAAYVKALEASGARVVPILINQSKDYYMNILTKINGVLFPGGPNGVPYEGYINSGQIVLDIITQMNNKNDYFPLFGIGLGFDIFTYLMAKKPHLGPCAAMNLPATLNFSEGLDKSRMLGKLDGSLKKLMEEKPLTFNYHSKCTTPKNFTRSKLSKYFNVLAVSSDAKNETFVSVVEGKKYPFYGIMFQPEMVQFNFVIADPINSIPHSLEAIQVSQYFYNFFVDEARKNTHQFPNLDVEDAMLMYNYNPVFTGKYGSGYVDEQIYFF